MEKNHNILCNSNNCIKCIEIYGVEWYNITTRFPKKSAGHYCNTQKGMKNMKWQKRLMSLVLAGCMAVSLLATTAMATDVVTDDEKSTTTACPIDAHKWDDGKITVKPTATTTGLKVYTCKICGETKVLRLPKQPIQPVNKIFADVPANSWYIGFVQYVYSYGLMDGTGATTFSPNAPLTRAMVAQILYAQAYKPQTSGASLFSDVADADAWYYDAIVWAGENQVVAGYPDGTFKPMQSVTREELAMILYAREGKPKIIGGWSLKAFADADDVQSWAKDAVIWAYQNGIVNGSLENGKLYLDPQGNATRAEAATMLTKYLALKDWAD